jgi:glycosyltransferase involved in cell wall biosynthesis
VAPEVSVLVPAFDAAATVASALRSVQRQTLRNWECVLVDDGSRDDTRALAEGFARQDPRVRVLSVPHGASWRRCRRALPRVARRWSRASMPMI